MRKFTGRAVVAQAVAVAAVLALSGVAAAVSGGQYSPKQMDCSPGADNYSLKTSEAGCHTLKVNVESGGTRYAEFGVDQMPNGSTVNPGLFGEGSPGSDNFPHAFCASVNDAGTGGGQGNNCGADGPTHGTGAQVRGDLNAKKVSEGFEQDLHNSRPGVLANISKQGLDFYLGADDNLDGGEHDGVDGLNSTGTQGVQNGPSDGGAVNAHVHPQDATATPTAYNPVPAAGASFGSCADGICEDATTYRETVYQGGGSGSREAADYSGMKWDPFNCSSGDLKGEKSCAGGKGEPQTMAQWRDSRGATYADPGVQTYEDPDPQGSPIDPSGDILNAAGVKHKNPTPLYPLPGNYVGTCGVIVNGVWRTPNLCK